MPCVLCKAAESLTPGQETSGLNKRVIVIPIVRYHVGVIIWVLLLRGVGLPGIHLVIVVLVEWIWRSEAIETVTLLGHLRGHLHERVVVITVVRHHVGVIIWVLLLWGVGLPGIHLVIVVLVEWIWRSEAIETITLLGHLGGHLHERVV